ncbi:MAG: outer membrane lipoprotein carrier protein LolA [Bacteroidetes bacterium]|nr:outer membrane lipoprotein carrier protein LolA [Bacteroidota bacterium]
MISMNIRKFNSQVASVYFLLSTFYFLLLTSVHAQQPKEVVDAKAKGILDEVAAKTKTYTSIKAEFTNVTEKQETNAKSKVTDTQTGTLQLKGTKYKLEFKGQTIFCDSKTQWTYIKESNEVQVNNAPDPKETDNINPVNIFTLYEKGYKYKYEKEDVVSGVKVDIVNLYPLDAAKKTYHTIRLTIDREKKQIIAVKIINKNGTSSTITVKNFTPNSDMPDTMFTFSKADYKGVEVVDLRDN